MSDVCLSDGFHRAMSTTRVSTQVPVLAALDWNGVHRKVMFRGNRNRFFYAHHRVTGQFLLGKTGPFYMSVWDDYNALPGKQLSPHGSKASYITEADGGPVTTKVTLRWTYRHLSLRPLPEVYRVQLRNAGRSPKDTAQFELLIRRPTRRGGISRWSTILNAASSPRPAGWCSEMESIGVHSIFSSAGVVVGW